MAVNTSAFAADAVSILNSSGSEEHKTKVLDHLARAHGLDVPAAPVKKGKRARIVRGPRGHVKNAVVATLDEGPHSLRDLVFKTAKPEASIRSTLSALVRDGSVFKGEDNLYQKAG
jgi:hypothetical protein